MSTIASMEPASLREALESGSAPRVLDVRTPGEFDTAHIPGAYNVPLDTLREHRDELARHLDEDVVLVCQSGTRAAQAEHTLAQTGLPNLRVLRGGMAAWEQSGAPVNGGRQRWGLERQVRLVAGALVLAATVGSIVVPPVKWVAAFVGGGLAFAAVSNTCAMASLLSKLPYNRGPACDARSIIAALGAEQAQREGEGRC